MDSRVINELIIESIDKGNEVSFRVVTGSMTPLISVGDEVKVTSLNSQSNIRVGDIAMFKVDEVFLVHRIIGFQTVKGKRYVRQKGDAVIVSELTSEDSIVGIVNAISKGDCAIDLTTGNRKKMSLALGCTLRIIDAFERQYFKIRHFMSSLNTLETMANRIDRILHKIQIFSVRVLIQYSLGTLEPKTAQS